VGFATTRLAKNSVRFDRQKSGDSSCNAYVAIHAAGRIRVLTREFFVVPADPARSNE
jgi:hypothetical protein